MRLSVLDKKIRKKSINITVRISHDFNLYLKTMLNIIKTNNKLEKIIYNCGETKGYFSLGKKSFFRKKSLTPVSGKMETEIRN